MPDNPKYDLNTVVYFKTSAARGFLEPVKIGIIAKVTTGWVYGITYRAAEPITPSVFGDRINIGRLNPQTIYYTEDEFVTYCEALGLAEAYLSTQLASIQALITTNCGTSG